MSPIFENQTGNVNSRRTDRGPDKERKDAGNDSVEKRDRQTMESLILAQDERWRHA